MSSGVVVSPSEIDLRWGAGDRAAHASFVISNSSKSIITYVINSYNRDIRLSSTSDYVSPSSEQRIDIVWSSSHSTTEILDINWLHLPDDFQIKLQADITYTNFSNQFSGGSSRITLNITNEIDRPVTAFTQGITSGNGSFGTSDLADARDSEPLIDPDILSRLRSLNMSGNNSIFALPSLQPSVGVAARTQSISSRPDLLRQVHADALKHISQDSIRHDHIIRTDLEGRVLDLMIKNVTKGDPLTQIEINELKTIRNSLSKEHWNRWLALAREEKKRRDAIPQHNYSQNNLKAKITKPSHKVDDSIGAVAGASSDNGSRSSSPVSDSDLNKDSNMSSSIAVEPSVVPEKVQQSQAQSSSAAAIGSYISDGHYVPKSRGAVFIEGRDSSSLPLKKNSPPLANKAPIASNPGRGIQSVRVMMDANHPILTSNDLLMDKNDFERPHFDASSSNSTNAAFDSTNLNQNMGYQSPIQDAANSDSEDILEQMRSSSANFENGSGDFDNHDDNEREVYTTIDHNYHIDNEISRSNFGNLTPNDFVGDRISTSGSVLGEGFAGVEVPSLNLSGRGSKFVIQYARTSPIAQGRLSSPINHVNPSDVSDNMRALASSSNAAKATSNANADLTNSNFTSAKVSTSPTENNERNARDYKNMLFGAAAKQHHSSDPNPGLSNWNPNQSGVKSPEKIDQIQKIARNSQVRIDSAVSSAKYVLASLNDSQMTDAKAKSTASIIEQMMVALEKSKTQMDQLNQITTSIILHNNDDLNKLNNSSPDNFKNSFQPKEISDNVFYDAQESYNRSDFAPNRSAKAATTPMSSLRNSYSGPSSSTSRSQTGGSVFVSRANFANATNASQQNATVIAPATSARAVSSGRVSFDNATERDERDLRDSRLGSTAVHHQSLLNVSNRDRVNNSGDPMSVHGFVWNGQRYNEIQSTVTKVCVANGPLVKAFEEFPIRIDIESSSLDLVWREMRMNSSGNFGVSGGNAHSTTLRRERFVFDDIFAGPASTARLSAYCRQRTKKAIFMGKNLVFTAVGCGESSGKNQLEPTIQGLLGQAGGQGIVSECLDELFRVLTPYTQQHLSSQNQGATLPHNSFVSTKIQYEQENVFIHMSACIVSGSGQIHDIFRSSGSKGAKCYMGKDSDGNTAIMNCNQISLKSVLDYERVVGVILGRRSAFKEVIQSSGGMFQNKLSKEDLQWIIGDSATTLWVTVSVHGGNLITNNGGNSLYKGNMQMHFVCPCGEKWGAPGPEICLLAEGISSIPHPPTPTMIKCCPLVNALLDTEVKRCNTDFINLALINRDNGGAGDSARDYKTMIGEALLSLRVIANVVV